jgi:hypothetical protein
LPDEVEKACDDLIQTVDENYNLAKDIDLISDAEMVVKYLQSKPAT